MDSTSYPCHSGLLQALAERFNRRFNTFGTAEGETSFDLWAFHRISSLSSVCLDDLHWDYSTGTGSYVMPYSFRYLMKVWRDLARCGKEQSPKASQGNVQVSFTVWVCFFYNSPYCFCNGFASDTHDLGSYTQLSVDFEDNQRHLCAPQDRGWNPRRLPDKTYLAAYLVYWLGTFVLPFGEEGLLVSPGLILLAVLTIFDLGPKKVERDEYVINSTMPPPGTPFARIGFVAFVTVENSTRLLDLWGVVAGHGKVVKIPPEGVVLPPTFSPAPSDMRKQKQAASYSRKRRASKETGPLQRATRRRILKPSSSSEEAFLPPRGKGPIGDTLHEDANALADDNYNPTFDGTSSPDEVGLPRASPLEQGHASAGVVADEEAGCPDMNISTLDGSTSLQTIHDLLTSGLEMELPNCADFNFIESDGRTWSHVLHSANTARFIEGFIADSPAIADPPPTVAVVGTGPISFSLATTFSPPGAGGPSTGGSADALVGGCSCLSEDPSLKAVAGDAREAACPEEGSGSDPSSSGAQAVDGDLLQPSLSEASLGSSGAFSSHDVSWPDFPQDVPVPGTERALEFLMGSIRTVMLASDPPPIKAVRNALRRNTRAYHLMGYPRGPWMVAVDSLWGEVRRLHQEATLAANRLRIQKLKGEIAQLEQEAKASRLRATAFMSTIEDASNRLAECELTIAVFDRGVVVAEAEAGSAASERECSDL
ncbi:hypothetical protein Taro_006436 [Colocasia esculenta]|uniref:Aminotransferase-like plant mobile domain-containing protein n=1 Tax=Colocasia esculenta TaxID=4460 RepID=A0A843TXD7_COLES|nr:hypothetical protein [Colocasia esculenta]